MSGEYAMTNKEIGLYLTIIMLYEQQQYMYDNRVHFVECHIVSISQPWLRPIVKGKVTVPIEFGAKFDLSLGSEECRTAIDFGNAIIGYDPRGKSKKDARKIRISSRDKTYPPVPPASNG